MKLRNLITLLALSIASITSTASIAAADVGQAPPPPPPPISSADIEIRDVAIRGAIQGENIRFTLDFTAECKKAEQWVVFVAGDVALDQVTEPAAGFSVSYLPEARYYVMRWRGKGTYKTSLTFAARPKLVEQGAWRESEFLLPAARLREIQVQCDRTDLEVRFPGALRATREVKENTLTVGAILGPGLPFVVRWKPQVEELDATLVLAGEANTIATIRAGALRLDSLYAFDISQGKLRELVFALPESLSITQVRGGYIRDWRIEKGAEGRRLFVSLNRPLSKTYALQVVAEMPLPALPAKIEIPVLKPEGLIRAGGHLAVGTDSAVQMVVEHTSGLSQTEPVGFPRLLLDREHDRPLPAAKAFYYSFASTPYGMMLALDDIVPSYDATGWCVIQVREEELSMDCGFDLDVRDAPLRDVVLNAPAAFTVAAVTGEEVQDYAVRAGADKVAQEVVVHFKKPVLGRTLVRMRLELGSGALAAKRALGGISVQKAKSERGFVAVAAEASVQVEAPVVTNLREVHVASIPIRVADAQFAYRYGEPGWSLELTAARKPAGLMAESFHLISLGDGVLYGYVVVNYFISGAPVDEFRFRVPREIENVEFVGGDIRRWARDGDDWVVKLQRKVIGDYNLAVSYSHPWKAGDSVTVGGIECNRVERSSGFICVSSRLNLLIEAEGKASSSLLEVKNEEVPVNYRLLLNAPVLKAYKFVATPHHLPLKISTYEHSAVLPVAIELMELDTQLNITDAGATESVTRIRYKVKNASSQFLSLTLPKGVAVWSTRLIERDAKGAESATRLTTSMVGEGVLMIPLKRLRDPNQPMTIELIYGAEHPELKYGGRLKLAAPTGPVQTAYASWSVTAPQDWSASAAPGGSMVPGERNVEDRADLGDVLQTAAASWLWAMTDGLPTRFVYIVGITLVLLGAVALFLRGGWTGRIALALLMLGLLWVGICAAGAPQFRSLVGKKDLRTVTYTRALGLDDAPAMSIAAHVTPAWRRSATWTTALIVPALGVALILLGRRRFRRSRHSLAAIGIVCLLSGVARFALGATTLVHLFTWGLPVLLLIWLAARLRLPARPAAAVATAMLSLILLMPGCAAFAEPLPSATTINSAAYDLTAEKDSMKVIVTLHVSTPAPVKIPLIPAGAILLSDEKIAPNLEMLRQDGSYVLEIKKAGRYDVTVEFLQALPEAGENQVRGYRLALPLALTSQVTLHVPEAGVDIVAPTAVSFTREQVEGATVAKALLGPGDAIEFAWKPGARERDKEQTAFYADVVSLLRFDAGLARGRHRVRFQIAQGELKEIRMRAPANVTITAVEGENLGAWRFNPETHEMEARLTQPAAGEYILTVTTQTPIGPMPSAVLLSPLKVLGASNQRDILGLTTSAAVQITPAPHEAAMNVDDFAREAAALLSGDATVKEEPIRYAYRIQSLEESLSVETTAVRPEIRSQENATFTVSEERLLYNGELRVSVAKAGVFSLDLAIPEGYDIDALGAPEVSHWDETAGTGGRIVQVHLRNKLLGELLLKATLSRSVADLPAQIVVPRIEVKESLKHTGQLSISSSRNVRLSVKERLGVSEISALDLGVRIPGALAFNLLRPDWQVTLLPEAVKPRVNVEFLHVAEVSDGLVRHTQYLRYRFYNAGQKILEVQAPKGALGLEISGAEIAHLKESDPENRIWRIELARQQFEEPYLLKLRFETQFDRAEGKVTLEPSQALNVDLQTGNVVVSSTDRVELAEGALDKSVQPADARNLLRTFGAGDLSGAAFCYRCPELPYRLEFRATRHQAASLLEATVIETTLDTVLSETGGTITHVHMLLRVGSKRHLEARLPAGAQVWSLSVNLSSEVPSKRRAEGGELLLIPLAQAVSGDLPVEVNLLYIAPPAVGATLARDILTGPQFDLPLQNVRWRLYLPEHYKYSDFVSTLNVNEDTLKQTYTTSYDIGSYERQVVEFNSRNLDIARELQAKGNQLAQSGKQQEARQALSWANNYAFNDAGLNEDTRVQLNNLMRQQAVVGLVDRRNQIRQKTGEAAAQTDKPLGAEFDLAQAERIRNSLNRDDNDNLEAIVKRLVEMQEEVSRAPVQLMLNAPLRGRVIELTRTLQVKPDAAMDVSFQAKRELSAPVKRTWLWGGGLAALLSLLFLADRGLAARRAAVKE